MLSKLVRHMIIQFIIISINLVVFYIYLIRSTALSADEGVCWLTTHILWSRDCHNESRFDYCQGLARDLKVITQKDFLLSLGVNLVLRIPLHLIVLELLDEAADISKAVNYLLKIILLALRTTQIRSTG